MERPTEFGNREFLTEEEVAEKATRDSIQAQGASAQDLDGVVRPRDLTRTTGYDKNIVGQEYNRFWTDTGPRKQRENLETNIVCHRSTGRANPPLHSGRAAEMGDKGRPKPWTRPTRLLARRQPSGSLSRRSKGSAERGQAHSPGTRLCRHSGHHAQPQQHLRCSARRTSPHIVAHTPVARGCTWPLGRRHTRGRKHQYHSSPW